MVDKTVTTTVEDDFTLTNQDIMLMLVECGKIPHDYTSSEVTFHVPGGGDYSNQVMDISNKDPIHVSYSKSTIIKEKM